MNIQKGDRVIEKSTGDEYLICFTTEDTSHDSDKDTIGGISLLGEFKEFNGESLEFQERGQWQELVRIMTSRLEHMDDSAAWWLSWYFEGRSLEISAWCFIMAFRINPDEYEEYFAGLVDNFNNPIRMKQDRGEGNYKDQICEFKDGENIILGNPNQAQEKALELIKAYEFGGDYSLIIPDVDLDELERINQNEETQAA